MSKIARYALGIVMGVLIMAGIQYKQRYEDHKLHQKRLFNLSESSFKLGCLVAYPMGTGNVYIPPQWVAGCDTEAQRYRSHLKTMEFQ